MTKPRTARELVAIGYMRGWLKPPVNPEQDPELVYKLAKNRKDRESRQRRMAAKEGVPA